MIDPSRDGFRVPRVARPRNGGGGCGKERAMLRRLFSPLSRLGEGPGVRVPTSKVFSKSRQRDPHPALRAVFSQREKESPYADGRQ